MKYQYVKVDCNLVHQVSPEDVLICNGYVGLPSFITKETYDNDLGVHLNEAESEVFHKLYGFHIRYDHAMGMQECYVLKTIFPEIQKNALRKISKEIVDILNKYYLEIDEKYILSSDFIDENSEKLLLKLMGRIDLNISENDRATLGRVFECINFSLSVKVYYSTMFNDTNHPYYYKKEHEHVPGMMVIESVRQALYAYAYTFKKCKRGDVSISISTLNSNFYRYTQSNYPLKIMVEDNSEPADDINRVLKLKAKLFQRNSLVAEIVYEGSIMKLNTFKRLRVMGSDEDEYVFYPIKDGYDTLILISDNSSCISISKLKEISMKGMRLFISNKDIYESNQKFKFILGIKNNRKIIAECLLESKEDIDNGMDIFVRFIDLSKNTIMDISDYIKNYTYIYEKGLII
ncbi:MAG: AfsA-related hotdog domain-containing protein [Gammaproteobacteria bacterium]